MFAALFVLTKGVVAVQRTPRSFTPWLANCLGNAVGSLIATLVAAGIAAAVVHNNPEVQAPKANPQNCQFIDHDHTIPIFSDDYERTLCGRAGADHEKWMAEYLLWS